MKTKPPTKTAIKGKAKKTVAASTSVPAEEQLAGFIDKFESKKLL